LAIDEKASVEGHLSFVDRSIKLVGEGGGHPLGMVMQTNSRRGRGRYQREEGYVQQPDSIVRKAGTYQFNFRRTTTPSVQPLLCNAVNDDVAEPSMMLIPARRVAIFASCQVGCHHGHVATGAYESLQNIYVHN